MATATAYMADITTPEKRTQRFGLIGAAFGLGFIIGPVIGGELGEFGPKVPFFAAAGRYDDVTVAGGVCSRRCRLRQRGPRCGQSDQRYDRI